MRGKVAKRLRRGAELASVGMPAAAYNHKAINKPYTGIDGKKRYFQIIVFWLKDDCTRKAYKMNKRFWMRAQRAGYHA